MMYLRQGAYLKGGRYQILKMIGQGGFGITYLADQRVTVKGGIGEIDTTIKVVIKEFFMKDSCKRDNSSSCVNILSEDKEQLIILDADEVKQQIINFVAWEEDILIRHLKRMPLS